MNDAFIKFQNNFRIVGSFVALFILLADCFYDLWEIFHYDWYRVMQADSPDWLVCIRYVVSVSLRILMLWAIAGTLTRQEQYRKLLVGLCIFNILTVFLHHRYESFVYISNYLGTDTQDFAHTVTWFGHHIYSGAAMRMLSAWVEEIFPAFIGLVFFMHPHVKRSFR